VFNFDLCCDQDVVYDPHNRIFIWYMQGDGGSFKLATSRDLDHWNSWNVRAYGFDSRWIVRQYANLWWDYPQLGITNNNLFITTNVVLGNPEGNPPRAATPATPTTPASPACGRTETIRGQMITFGCGGIQYFTSAVLRLNLGQLSQGLHPIPVSYFYDGIGFGLAEGAHDEMFIGGHISSNNQIKVIGWNDAGGFRSANRDITAWNHQGERNCPLSDGSNPCASILYQIHSGWIRNGKVGFFWNVGSDHGCTQGETTCFPYPHVDAATFNTNNLEYIGRPLIWNPNYSWLHAFASPNDRGIGVVAWKVAAAAGGGRGNPYFPSIWAGIQDNFNHEPPGWEMHLVGFPSGLGSAANFASTFNRLGDYLRVRPFGGGSSNLWIGSGYVIQGGQTIYHEFVFGREADIAAFNSIAFNFVPEHALRNMVAAISTVSYDTNREKWLFQ
jgi:hypothetical protein